MATRKALMLAAFLVLLVALVGCGDANTTSSSSVTAVDDSAASTGDTGATSTSAAELTKLTAVIPFPSGVAFYPLFVAEDLGYFAAEGLAVTTQPVDGSGACIQQVRAGQAQVGFPSPGPFMQAVDQGEELRSVYTLYQSNVFSVVTPEGSGITKIADLKGKTVGVGALDGGETAFTKALLSEVAGLKEGVDYKLLAVGDGGTAYAGLSRGDVSAYAASFPDVAILRLRGAKLTNLVPADYQSFFDSVMVVEKKFIEENPGAIKGFGRALAKATVWGMANPEETLKITGKYYPEELQDAAFSLALLKETQSLFQLPADANGQWGTAIPASVKRYMDYLVAQGEIPKAIDPAVFMNDFVKDYNDFDPNAL